MKPNDPHEDLPQMHHSQATLDLIDKMSPHLHFETVPPRRRFYYVDRGIHMCIVIRSGVIRVRRDTDEIVISSVPVPNIMGIGNLMPKSSGLFIETLSECEVATLTAADAQQLVGELNAWNLLAGHITKVANNLFVHSIIMTAPTAYEVIRFQLYELMREKPEIRETTSAAKYILQRTRLSRSTVMKILAQLKQGDFIELDDGMLKVINKLPKKY
ncbi:MAG: helix-turn-helix domain-containing protein [Silvania sp.]